MLDFGEFKDRVLRILGDPGGSLFDTELLYDACVAAHDAILPWVPCTTVAQVEANGDSTVFELPSGAIEIEAVRDTNTGVFLPRSMLVPGNYRGDDIASNDWIEYPPGYLNLAQPIDDPIEVFCVVGWEKPVHPYHDDFWLLPPTSAHQGMVYYAASICLGGKLTSAANIGQYKTKPDIGDPEDNPMQRAAIYFKSLFLDEMSRQPRRHGVSS